MSYVFERAFRVRHYECDAYGHVNHANYLRYMQETAFDASTAVGYDVARYRALGHFWLVRESDITFLNPLTYGDTVIVKTWVADFRRVRSRRMYAMRQAQSGQLVATAHTDWVYLNADSLQPATIPPEMRAAFLPADARQEKVRREKFPQPPLAPPGVFTLCKKVQWRDLDEMQHVNNAVYLAYLEDCGMGVLADGGWPMMRLIENGFGIVVRRYRIEYRQPAFMDDELALATWVSDVKRATAVRHFTITRIHDAALLLRARLLLVFVDLQTGQPIRIPPDFLADFGGNIVG